jgi:hypothetical protein
METKNIKARIVEAKVDFMKREGKSPLFLYLGTTEYARLKSIIENYSGIDNREFLYSGEFYAGMQVYRVMEEVHFKMF